MFLSVVIPCFNEADNVLPLYEKVCSTLENKTDDFEFVFVNDGSKDETLANLKSICETSPHTVKVVSFSRNFGKEAAIYAGLEHAEGDLISLIDADLQQDPAYIVKMVDYLNENPDCDCVAAYQEERREGAFRAFCKRRFYRLINKLSDTEFVDGASDFRTFRSSMKDAILEMSEYHRFSKGIFSWVGFNTYYMPYEAEERLSGTTKWSFGKLCKYAIEGIVAFTTVPLKISTWVGCLTSLGALIYIIAVIIEKFAYGIDVPGYATIVILILFLGGLQLLALGINGEYLARTYIQSKHRPVYIAKEVLSNKK
ncbi:MAG: glycosyltransferase family 2 protein [Clostridia bacterium]|nr:glycosyltransferase family 2 protein [Clostridia bacterium]MBQ2092075.1 glycosyltransferase family 2 protein [Clostridia bacterium]